MDKQQLEALSTDELRQTASIINNIIDNRQNEHKKFLWDAVISAIRIYESHYGAIRVYDEYSDPISLEAADYDFIGEIHPKFI